MIPPYSAKSVDMLGYTKSVVVKKSEDTGTKCNQLYAEAVEEAERSLDDTLF